MRLINTNRPLVAARLFLLSSMSVLLMFLSGIRVMAQGCSCADGVTITLSGSIPGFKVAGGGKPAAQKIEVDLLPGQTKQFTFSKGPLGNRTCSNGTAAICGKDLEYMLIGAPADILGATQFVPVGQDIFVWVVGQGEGVLQPSGFLLRRSTGKQDEEVKGDPEPASAPENDPPAGANPPSRDDNGNLLPAGARVVIPTGKVGFGLGGSAPFRDAGFLSWSGLVTHLGVFPVGPANAVFTTIDEVTALPAGTVTYDTDNAYPDERHVVTPTRIFRLTGFGEDPGVIGSFSTSPNSYVREYVCGSSSEAKSVTFSRDPVSWWKIREVDGSIDVETSKDQIVRRQNISSPFEGKLVVSQDGTTQSVMVSPAYTPSDPDAPEVPLPWPTNYDKETINVRGGVTISRTYETFIKTALGFQIATSERFPDPQAATGLVTSYGYYPDDSEDAGKLWWISRPDSWEVYQYVDGLPTVITPFESEVILNPDHDEPATLPLTAVAGTNGRIRVRVPGLAMGEPTQIWVRTPGGPIADGVLEMEFESSADMVGDNTPSDTIPDELRLLESEGRISYSPDQPASSSHSWLAGRVLLEYDRSGKATLYEYERTPLNYIKTTSTSGVFTTDVLSASNTVGSYVFHKVPGLSEQTVEIRAPFGLVSRRSLYLVVGPDFESAKLEEFEYLKGHYHRTVIEGVETHRVDRPDSDPLSLIEKDASGVVTKFHYDVDGYLLWSEKAEGGGVPAIRTSYERSGFTTTTRVNGVVVGVTVVDGLGRVVSRSDASGAGTSISYPNNGLDTLTVLPGDIEQRESRHLDGSLWNRSGNGWVNSYHSTGVAFEIDGYFETESVGSSTGHTARATTRFFDEESKLLKVLLPSPTGSTSFIEEMPVYYSGTGIQLGTKMREVAGNILFNYQTVDLPDHQMVESLLNPFPSAVVAAGGLKISGLDLNANSILALGTADRLRRRETSYVLDGPVVYRKVRDFRYPDPTGDNPLITETRSSVGFVKVGTGYQRVTIVVEPSGRSLKTTTLVTPGDATVIVTEDDSATPSTADKVTKTKNGYLQTVERAGIAQKASYVHDTFGRVTQYTDHRNASTFWRYSSNFLVESVVDHLRNTTTYTYYTPTEPNAGKVKTVTKPGGIVETFSYNERGQVTGSSGSGTYPRTYEYDAFGDMVTMQTEGPGTPITRWTYEEGTGLLQTKRYNDASENGLGFSYSYTPDAKLAGRHSARNIGTGYVYDPITRDLTNINYVNDADLTPDVTFSEFDGLGRPGKITEVKSGTDAHTNEQTLVYQRNSGAISIAYDEDHRWLPKVSVEHRPEDAGRPKGFDVKVDNASVSYQTYGYDDFNRLAQVSSADLSAGFDHLTGADTVLGVNTHRQTVTNESKLIHSRKLAVDLLGRTVGVVNKAGPNAASLTTIASVGHAYDAAGRRANARREDGTWWDYDYNSRSEVTGAEKRISATQLVPGLNFDYEYDAMGNRVTSTDGVSSREYTSNALNQYEEIKHNGKLNILTRSDGEVTATAANATPDDVDHEGQFYGIRQTASNGSSGQLVTTTVSRAGVPVDTVQTWVPKATLDLREAYDADGNLITDGRWTYTWDGENRLVSMVKIPAPGESAMTLKFAYDWMGRRIGKTVAESVAGSNTFTHLSFAYDHWNPVAEWSRANLSTSLSNTALKRTHLWGPDIGSSVWTEFGDRPDFQAAGGVAGLIATTFHDDLAKDHFIPSYDANGNILAWSDGIGTLVQRMDYDPFGNIVIAEKFDSGQAGKLPTFGFSTKHRDRESGLSYYGYRYYDPVTGRWPSRDPVGLNWSTNEFNEYSFITNDGLNYFDNLGLQKDYARERAERDAARKRDKEQAEREKNEAEERRRRVDKHYRDNPSTKGKSCKVEIVWGHGSDAEEYVENDRGDAACYGPLGCYIDSELQGRLIPGFPACPGGIGDADYCSGKYGNGGFNPNGGKTQKDRQEGFSRLLEQAISAAFREAESICQKSYDKPPCCKQVAVLFNGIGERDGANGNEELKRRLGGANNSLNKPPINGVHEGKVWNIDCKNVVK